MGMLLRRREKKAMVEPKVNGKPVAKEPKVKKLNQENIVTPSYKAQ